MINMTNVHRAIFICWLIIINMFAMTVQAEERSNFCGSLQNHYGPFNYISPQDYENRLPIVEQYHFTSRVESLMAGESGSLLADLDYVLRAFPNHHRALNAISRYDFIDKTESPYRTAGRIFLTVDCYFDRAMRFQPEDGSVKYLYGLYLHKKKKYKDAIRYYNESLELMPGSSELHYNLGLLYFNIKKWDLAGKHAKIAYGLGYPLPWLKDKLKEAKLWEE